MTMFRPRSFWAAGLLIVLGAAAMAADQTPEEVLKSRGLTKSGTLYVLDAEADFLEKFAKVQPLYLQARELHNKLFAIAAEQEGSAFVADTMGAWREILCVQEDRTVGNDNTVKWQRLSLQLPPSRLRPHFVKANVRVHEYPDGALAVYWGPHRLADYDAAGVMVQPGLLVVTTEPSRVRIRSRDGMQGEQAYGT